jgi:hypothetical protein
MWHLMAMTVAGATVWVSSVSRRSYALIDSIRLMRRAFARFTQ